jgi:hypothetical protein
VFFRATQLQGISKRKQLGQDLLFGCRIAHGRLFSNDLIRERQELFAL